MKLSKRLQQLDDMVLSGYDHIWDCCCDHGFLGGALLMRQAAPNIHFVDIVVELMNELEQKLVRLNSSSKLKPTVQSNWFTHCIDVAKLPLDKYCGNHLIIIAGVGGDLISEFIQSIHHNYPKLNIDFLLCPVHHQFKLRQALISINCSLKNEALIQENQRFYEIIHASNQQQGVDREDKVQQSGQLQPVSAVGTQIWQANTTENINVSQQYLQKILSHYQRIQLDPNANVQHIIDAYQSVDIATH
ncbi:tRNA (adenine(22)-N(1))-methyltransferase TrmK [Shewanella sp. 1_MG-2023]|uniref:tRNA (adenine(22)-N(1))-methyltransferase n=1 Tax=unclassified Shewanella TaxID=196818 RepID=UPI0026E1632C|nr:MULTISPECIES: tRNA (adenine(22)-N(1))-methyltransferase TrmK [unclassified Shewanella]MDO6610929.1 tRNA (adenine(22)-N(1))-methyltransferase TrmK [Shewanella sp. 7_MG-2023]MDO6770220.1 tRNA (adenine(22)-N(1))-methyltransferase TrmK [Shewanella sp. 2_MG-2023]MDO6793361.1 tRNA (adenine(22)-N(1))-methyltransferase TrmK [Shewanella sp. 1_MG-2023]